MSVQPAETDALVIHHPNSDAEDAAVIELALRELIKNEDFYPGWERDEKVLDQIVLGPFTMEPGYFSGGWYKPWLLKEEYDIPDDIYRSLASRNSKRVCILGLPIDRQLIEWTDNKPKFDSDGKRIAFQQRWPRAKGWAYVTLPGFSADGKKSLIYLEYGPTAHGAEATYYLEKGSQGWQIKRKRIKHAV